MSKRRTKGDEQLWELSSKNKPVLQRPSTRYLPETPIGNIVNRRAPRTSEESTTSASPVRKQSSSELESSDDEKTIVTVSTPKKESDSDSDLSLHKFATPSVKSRSSTPEQEVKVAMTGTAPAAAVVTTTTVTLTNTSTSTTSAANIARNLFPEQQATGTNQHLQQQPSTSQQIQQLPPQQIRQQQTMSNLPDPTAIMATMMPFMQQQAQLRQDELARFEYQRQLDKQAELDRQNLRQLERQADLERRREEDAKKEQAEFHRRKEEAETQQRLLDKLEEMRKQELECTERLRLRELEAQRAMFNSNRPANLIPMKESDDIDTFLATFELTAQSLKWDKSFWVPKLLPVLTPKAQEAVHNLATENSLNFDRVKEAILAKYQINEEFYRQKFRFHRKKPADTFKELASALVKFRDKWLKVPVAIESCQDVQILQETLKRVLEAVAVEQFYTCIESDFLKLHITQQKVKTIAEAADSADEYVLSKKKIGSEHASRPAKTRFEPKTRAYSDAEKEPRADAEKTSVPPISLRDLSPCQHCKKTNHLSKNCWFREGKRAPPDANHNPNSKNEKAKQPGFSGLARSPDKNRCELTEKRKALGRLNGKLVELLLDSGSDVTLVRADLVRHKQISDTDLCQIGCVFGDNHTAPTTKVLIEIMSEDGSVVSQEMQKFCR